MRHHRDKLLPELALLISTGWRNMWKQKLIFLFPALSYVAGLFDIRSLEAVRMSHPFGWLGLFLAYWVVLLYGWSIIIIGPNFTAYCAATDQPVSIRETLDVVRRVWRRVLGCGLLVVLAFLPILCLAAVFSFSRPFQPTRFMHTLGLFLIPVLLLMPGLTEFMLSEMIVQNAGIRKAFAAAWSLLSAQYRVLFVFGVLRWLLWYVLQLLNVALALLIQSGFAASSLSRLDFITPSASGPNHTLVQLLFIAVSILFAALTTSVFVSAYVKYRDALPAAA